MTNLRGQIPEVDGLRGIAILLVMLHHYWPSEGPIAFGYEVAVQGWVGVDLFFVISGFLITGILLDNLGDPHYFRTFYSRRVLRIFPLYYLVLTALTVLPLLGPKFYDLFADLWTFPVRRFWYFLYLGNLREMFNLPETTPNLVWSLAIEEQFYIVFPLIVWLKRGRIGRLLGGVMVFALAFRLITWRIWPATWTIQVLSTPARLDTLAVGALLAVWLRRGVRLPSARQSSWILAGLTPLLIFVFWQEWMEEGAVYLKTFGLSQVALTFGALVLWVILHRGSRLTAVFRFAPLRYTGKICYGLYLLHTLCDLFATNFLTAYGMDENSGWLMLIKFALSYAVASLMWYCFEAPILKLKNRFNYAARDSVAAA